MAYRLRSHESVSHGLRRLATKELRAARKELQSATPRDDTAIHEARKSVKKARAILQVVEADDGRGLKDSRKRLRRVNRTLSRLRDADAMMEILAKLRSRNPHVLSEHTFARVQRQLLTHKRTVVEAAERDGVWKKVGRELQRLEQHAKRWRPTHSGVDALAAGVRFVHRRGRKAMARALKRQDAADFHEWRKQIKALWYQLRLVEPHGGRIRRHVGALDRAETLLGDDHNVVVLCAELSKDASLCGPVELDRLRLAAGRLQCESRTKAIARVRRIYSRTPGDYWRGVKRAIKEASRHDRARHNARPRRAAA